MSASHRFACLGSCASLVLILTACSDTPASDRAAAAAPATAAPSTPAPASAGEPARGTAQTGDTHAHKAPHGGALIELGDEHAHLELVLDARSGTLTAYALDGEAERAVRLAQPTIALEIVLPVAGGAPGRTRTVALDLPAVANALTGEAVGDTSQFAATSDALRGASAFTGTVARIAIKGQTFTNVAFRFPQGSDAH